MKKHFLLLVALFVVGMMLPPKAAAQNYDDVVYLKNGSVIRGVIVEQRPNESLKIQTYDGNVFFYEMGEIEKFTKEVSNYRNVRTGYNRNSEAGLNSGNGNRHTSRYYKRLSYLGIAEIGNGNGVDYEINNVHLNVINGFRIVPQFAFGIGVGIRVSNITDYDGYTEKEATMPVFVHLRSDFIDRKVSPFFACNLGYNIALGGEVIHGYMFEPTLGVSINIGRANHKILAGICWNMSRIMIKSESYYYNGRYYPPSFMADPTDAIGFKVGFSF